MELYIVNFYDNNESGNVEHNELYTTFKAAKRRYNSLKKNLNCYSWVNMWNTKIVFGRVKYSRCLYTYNSCDGKDSYYHGDGDDF